MSPHLTTSNDPTSSTSAPATGRADTGPPATSHNNSGRFTKGNKGGPGNPFNRQVAALRKALLAGVTAEDIEEVLAVLMIKAKSGDLAAIKLLLSYTVGKPGPAVDPDTLDQQEWQLHQRAAVPPQQVHDLMGAVPAATANTVAQIAWPCAAQQHLQPVVAGLHAAEAATAVPTPAPRNREQTGTATDRTAPIPSREPQRVPSPNAGNGDRREGSPEERRSGRTSRPATPRPPDLPAHIDWEYEERITDILFSEDDSPPDSKGLNP